MRGVGEWVAHLRAHIPLALSGEDPEGVHQVRVAGRRLRVYLDLLGWRLLQDDLRRLVRGAGRVRDLEVALTGPSALPPGFRAHLAEELRLARANLPGLLASPWTEALLRALAVLPPLDAGVAEKSLERLVARAEARLAGLGREPSLEALHAYRRALRRVRYAKEFLGLPAKREKALQEVLGGLQDLDVLLGLLVAYLAQAQDPEAAALRERLEAKRQKGLAEVWGHLGLASDHA
ncbi:CHAD domain-containing protein [Thermus thermamylovorans]|uniref:CHAD domain-containing protein n=1 Tax=Thermus thermamylovorans TaxID=2509362 RepID=A0A4Q9B1A2_9DEIN|nr:CHAD domain-containing protein [Thermus thermamylovorans]TBH17278.1 CHAD domain-containing protein [Thermus thermamylovorans]